MDRDKNIQVLKHCPHFYTIINFEYYSEDIISEKLIDVYEKYIFSININSTQDIEKIEKLDKILYKYISDYCFREQMKSDINKVEIVTTGNILDAIVNAIISLFEKYESICSHKVQMTRWI